MLHLRQADALSFSTARSGDGLTTGEPIREQSRMEQGRDVVQDDLKLPLF